MKNLILILSIVLVLSFYTYKLSTKNYASNQANLICLWLNSELINANFSVGLQALAHLKSFKETNNKYSCILKSYERSFGYKNEISILISSKRNDLYLIYGSGYLKELFLPRYYQHASNDGLHHGY